MKYYITETWPSGDNRLFSWDGWPHEWENVGEATKALERFQAERPRNTFCLVPVTNEGKDIVRLIVGRNESDPSSQ